MLTQDIIAKEQVLIRQLNSRKVDQTTFDALIDLCFNGGCQGGYTQEAVQIINKYETCTVECQNELWKALVESGTQK